MIGPLSCSPPSPRQIQHDFASVFSHGSDAWAWIDAANCDIVDIGSLQVPWHPVTTLARVLSRMKSVVQGRAAQQGFGQVFVSEER